MVYGLSAMDYPTTWFSTNTPASPITEIIVSITDQDRIVSLIDKLKYSLNSQKPPSFTCEKARLPAPIASTIKLGLIDGSCSTIAETIPAAVRPATVADPRLTRIIAAISQPNM